VLRWEELGTVHLGQGVVPDADACARLRGGQRSEEEKVVLDRLADALSAEDEGHSPGHPGSEPERKRFADEAGESWLWTEVRICRAAKEMVKGRREPYRKGVVVTGTFGRI
jgi:hypothetical protein